MPATCSSSASSSDNQLVKVVVVGHVDHGKSTLLGRWLIDGGRIESDRIGKVERICSEKGIAFEPAFLLDAFEEEQSQGVSIDSTRVQLEIAGRKYLFIDVPGHFEFIKNMTTGASHASLGILVLDAAEGIQAQTERHLKILSILGLRHVIVSINKIDKVGYSETAFDALRLQAENLLQSLALNCVTVVPISALSGDNVLETSTNTSWYLGPSLLEAVSAQASAITHVDCQEPVGQFRMLLQDIYKLNDERYFAGRVISGVVRPGDNVFFSPSGKAARVKAIIQFPDLNKSQASAGESIAITLVDQIFVERGEVISPPEEAPECDTEFGATIVWMSQIPFKPGSEYLLKVGTAEVQCSLSVPDSGHLSGSTLGNGDIFEIVIKLRQAVAFDRIAGTGGLDRLVICSTYETVAAGVIDTEHRLSLKMPAPQPNVQREGGYLDRATRELTHGHKAGVLWLTGLSGAGKSTLAKSLERSLFEHHRVLAVDADTMRTGLCVDLGFTPQERSESIRRLAEVAKFGANMGFIVIVACLSPYRRDREMARSIIGDEDFHEIFVSCPLSVCQSRDPKGLYQMAREGSIKSFSGLDAPYQIPLRAALTLDSSRLTMEAELDACLAYLRAKNIIR